jgi:serine/threonine-protein kinase
MQAAPSAVLKTGRNGGWSLRLNDGDLQFSPATVVAANPWGAAWRPPKFDVIVSATIGIRIPAGDSEYEGRSHALWYCDAKEEGAYLWFETAFMISPLIPRRGRQNPFALDPGEDSAKALGPGLTEVQVAWPFSSLVLGTMDEFIDRWAGWFADASQGKLTHPRAMPERSADGTWRRS